jgi:transposase
MELPEIQMSVTHVVLHEAYCAPCGRIIKAELPVEYRYGYGPRLTALIRGLSGSQRDSRSAVQEFCTSVLGIPISRGAIQRAVDRVSEAITLVSAWRVGVAVGDDQHDGGSLYRASQPQQGGL